MPAGAATASRPEEVRTRAASASRTVIDFQERLKSLERELEEELGRQPEERARLREELERTIEAAAERLPLLGRLGEILQRLERVRDSERADDFGFDPEFEELIAPLFTFLYRRWWRVDVEGVEHVPSAGPALLVGNHAGAMFPYDGAMMKVALRLDHPARRELRPLVENFAYDMPFVASFMARVGGVRACPENAERLLRRGEVVAVFPEGVRGIGKPFRERYRLQRFGRGGFVALCMRTGSPLVPVAIVGAEEIHPLIGKWQWPAKLLGLPYLPITPTFPWLGLLGLVPLPTKWSIVFGKPIEFAGRYRPAQTKDDLLVDQITADVRDRIQEMVDRKLKERRSVFF
jgi:1-acyl-sn-glycerol-3-phosphate acyltransferase